MKRYRAKAIKAVASAAGHSPRVALAHYRSMPAKQRADMNRSIKRPGKRRRYGGLDRELLGLLDKTAGSRF